MARRARHAVRLGLAALVAGMLLAAALPRATGAPAGGTITIARPSDSVSLDAHRDSSSPGAWVYSNIYETLVKLTQDMRIEPALATSWEIQSTRRMLFRLRKGVRFHDGSPFNAQAVKLTFDRTLNPQNPGVASSNLGPVEGVEVVDDYAVVVITRVPFAPLLRALTMVNAIPMVSPEGVRRAGDGFGRNPSGTGPFKFSEWLTNTRIVLVRNDDYWGPKPALERVVFRVIPEDSARMLALETGEVDMVLGPAAAGLRRVRGNPKFKIAEVGGLRTLFYGFNNTLAPVNEVKVRQAINVGIDRKAIIDNVMEGIVEPATSLISQRVFGAHDISASWAYNRAKAEQLLDEAGWRKGPDGIRSRGGARPTLRLYTSRGRWPKDAETAEAIQAQLRVLGIDARVNVLEWAIYFQGLRRNAHADAHMLTLGWATTTGDADYGLRSQFACAAAPPRGWNAYNYCNKEYDELILRAMGSLDQDQRKTLYAKAQQILAHDVPAVAMYTYKEIVAHADYVRGYLIHPLDYYLWMNGVSVRR
ncbi:MAG: hypothetical protein HY660_04130 [Armatimonadetes bacterium]|nr:hypothetical protein [Armatimonadota bacterium]